MRSVRAAVRMAAWVSLAVLVAGLGLIAVASIEAGDFGAAREPLIGWGLDGFTIGLAAVGITLTLVDLVEPTGWWRLLAIPPIVVAATGWWVLIVVGLGQIGASVPGSAPSNDLPTLFYSAPQLAAMLLLDTLLIGLPLAANRLWLRLRVDRSEASPLTPPAHRPARRA